MTFQRARDRSLEQTLVREVTRTQRRTIAHAHHAHRRKALRLAFGHEATPHCGEQCFGHRVPATRTADQDRVAVGNKLRRFVCRDFFHVLLFVLS